MLKNFFTIAIRNLIKHKSFALINIAGLATGLACCFILLLYIQTELNVDKQHQDLDQLYRLNTIFYNTSNFKNESATSGPPIGYGLMQEIPEIESFTRIFSPLSATEYLVSFEDKHFYEEEARIADSTFFKIFHYPFLEGDPDQALKEPNNIALSHTLAVKLFGDEPALGKVISITDDFGKTEFMVTGVFDNKVFRSHMKVNYVTSMYTEGWGSMVHSIDNWAIQNFIYTYLKVKPGTETMALEKKINEVISRRGAKDFENAGFYKEQKLVPLQDIYLYSDANNEWSQLSSITFLKILSTISLLILVLASVNYINLTTAKSVQRAREIGLRKTLGAHRSQLIGQFLSEAFILSFVAVGIGVLISWWLLPYFNDLFNLTLEINLLDNPVQIFLIIGIATLAGVLSGFYPAIFLSGIMPIKALKINNQLSGGGGNLRRTLVVLQFVIAISLLVSVAVIFQQLQFSINYDANLNTESKIIIPLRTDQAETLFKSNQANLRQIKNINGVSFADYVPGKRIFNDYMVYKPGETQEEGEIIRYNQVDSSYLNIFDIEMVAGRNLYAGGNSGDIILNEEAAGKFGWSANEAVGQQLLTTYRDTTIQFNIVGVMANYNHLSIHEEMLPIMLSGGEHFGNAIVAFTGGNLNEIVAHLEKTWDDLKIDTPFDFYFLNDAIAAQYQKDKRSMAIITAFAVIAIIISGLGLYGLSTFTVQKRSKEISIRKVLGANSSGLIFLLTRQYLHLVLLAFIITIPLTYYLLNQWLENFAYHISINASIYVISGSVIAVFTLLIIIFHTYKSTQQNPVKALRND